MLRLEPIPTRLSYFELGSDAQVLWWSLSVRRLVCLSLGAQRSNLVVCWDATHIRHSENPSFQTVGVLPLAI
jgi:hypothetical protein